VAAGERPLGYLNGFFTGALWRTLNSAVERTAGSHSLAATAQRERF